MWLLALLLQPAPAGELYTVRTSDDMLQILDTQTLALSDVGLLGAAFDYGDLAWDPSSQTMFMVTGRAGQALYTVNLQTGAATYVGTHGLRELFAIAIDERTDELWGFRRSIGTIYRLDKTTGQILEQVTTFTNGADGADFIPQTQSIFGMYSASTTFYEFDPVAGFGNVLGSTDYVNNGGFAWDPDTQRFWSIDWSGSLHSYADDGTWTQVIEATGLGAHDGLEGTARAPGAFTLQTATACPQAGTGSISLFNATPSGDVVVVASRSPGSASIPAGPCAGTATHLAAPLALVGRFRADPNGVVSFTAPHPDTICGLVVQALDMSTCTASNVRVAQ